MNAYLPATGHSPIAVRRLRHDLALRSRCAVGAKLVLKKRTLGHLVGLSERRKYLTTRYDCAQAGTSELNRLAASLAEFSEMVSAYIRALKVSPA